MVITSEESPNAAIIQVNPCLGDFESIRLPTIEETPEEENNDSNNGPIDDKGILDFNPIVLDITNDNSSAANAITQTQNEIMDDASVGSTNDAFSLVHDNNDHDIMATDVNNALDDTADYLSVKLIGISDHRIISGMLELQVNYSNGEQSWHAVDMIICEDPQAAATYIINNDLGTVLNNRYRRWAQAFL